MQTNSAVEQSKIIRWSQSPCNQSGTEEKVYGGKDLLKSQVSSHNRIKLVSSCVGTRKVLLGYRYYNRSFR